MLTVGSFCTGIGGLDMAATSVYGGELVWYSEVESAPCLILEREHRRVPNLGDLTALDWSTVPPVDVLTAGYPCQPFSTAGKRQGTDDARHLWPYIAAAVRVLRPRRVVLENVAGHLSLGVGDVLLDLAEAGYDAEWCVLRASDVGAPHRRARLFIVAGNTEYGDDGWLHAGREQAGGDVERRPSTGAPRQRTEASDRPIADTRSVGRLRGPHLGGTGGDEAERSQASGHPGHGSPPRPSATPDTDIDATGRDSGAAPRPQSPNARWGEPNLCDGSPHGDRALPPDPSGIGRGPGAGLRTDEPGRIGRGRPRDDDGAPTPDTDIEGPQGPQSEGRRDMPPGGRGPVAWGRYEPAIRRWEHALGRPAPAPVDDRGRLSPPFVEWMQGYPSGWIDGLTRTQALKALGNAVVPQQGAAAIALLEGAHDQAVAS